MKIKDLNIDWQKLDDEGACECCSVSDIAQEKLPKDPKFTCPHCDKEFESDIVSECIHADEVVVATSNACHPETLENEEINRCLLVVCQHCDDRSVVALKPIIYNANHDVFYTGDGVFLAARDECYELNRKVQEAIAGSVKRWSERYEAGEKNLNFGYWIACDIEHFVAEAIQNCLKKAIK